MNCYNSYDSQTCLNLFRFNMIQIDSILKHVRTWNQNMTKYSKIWANGIKKVFDDNKVIPWIAASKSSDQKQSNENLGSNMKSQLRLHKRFDPIVYWLSQLKWVVIVRKNMSAPVIEWVCCGEYGKVCC
jgi:hypothetical protein